MNTEQSRSGAVLALDMGGTNLRRAVAWSLPDLQTPLQTWRERSNPTDPAGQIRQVVQAAHDTHGPLSHVTIGLPGVVHNGQIYEAPNLSALQDASALGELRLALPCPVTFMNDCNLAALGEGADDLAFIAIGTGLGCGLVRGGQVMLGEHGQAGEFGLLPFQDGVLEDLLSGPGLARRFTAYGGSGEALDFVGEAGERLQSDFQSALGYLLRVVTLSFDPRQIVFGGGLGLQLGDQIEAAWLGVRGELSHIPRPTLSRYGDDAALIGGLRLALSNQVSQ